MKSLYKKSIINWFRKKNINVTEKTDIYASKIIDSFDFIQLLFFLEKKHKLKLKHEKIFLKKKLTISELNKILEISANRKT